MLEDASGASAIDETASEASSRAADAWKRRDWKARVLHSMVRARSRMPGWHEEAIGVLAAAEADGVRVLEAALPAISDAKLRRVFLKHIEDEKRHTRGFTDFAKQLCPNSRLPAHRSQPADTNVLAFFAYLEITEVRGEQMIQNYHRMYQRYPEVQAFMETVLRDERYHANYLHNQLESWKKQGLVKEVAAARDAAARIDASGFRAQCVAFALALPRIVGHEIRTLVGRAGGAPSSGAMTPPH